MNRPLTVDTEYVNKLREGRLDEIAPDHLVRRRVKETDGAADY